MHIGLPKAGCRPGGGALIIWLYSGAAAANTQAFTPAFGKPVTVTRNKVSF
jgi:hypothetical protein